MLMCKMSLVHLPLVVGQSIVFDAKRLKYLQFAVGGYFYFSFLINVA